MLALLPEDTRDRLHLVPDGGAEIVAGVVDFRPILIANRGELGLLVGRQRQLPVGRDAMNPPVADVLLALIL